MNKKQLLRAGLFALSLGLSLSGLSHADCGGSDGGDCATSDQDNAGWEEYVDFTETWIGENPDATVVTDPDTTDGGNSGGDFQVTTDLDTGNTTTTGTEPTEPVLAVNDPNLTLVTNVTGTSSGLPVTMQTALDQQTALLAGTLTPTDPETEILAGTVGPNVGMPMGNGLFGAAVRGFGTEGKAALSAETIEVFMNGPIEQLVGPYASQNAASMAANAIEQLEAQYAAKGTPLNLSTKEWLETMTDLIKEAEDLIKYITGGSL